MAENKPARGGQPKVLWVHSAAQRSRLEECAPERAWLARLPPPVVALITEGQRFCVPSPFSPPPLTAPREFRHSVDNTLAEFFAPQASVSAFPETPTHVPIGSWAGLKLRMRSAPAT